MQTSIASHNIDRLYILSLKEEVTVSTHAGPTLFSEETWSLAFLCGYAYALSVRLSLMVVAVRAALIVSPIVRWVVANAKTGNAPASTVDIAIIARFDVEFCDFLLASIRT